jgi:hypothetical protein
VVRKKNVLATKHLAACAGALTWGDIETAPVTANPVGNYLFLPSRWAGLHRELALPTI